MAPFVLIAVVVALGIAGVLARRRRARALARLRADWGQPVDRDRKLDAMFASHRARLALGLIRKATECAAALDAQRGTTVRGR